MRPSLAVGGPGDARKSDASGVPWLRRPLPNWWLRTAVPALILFGGMLAVGVLSGDAHQGVVVYGTTAGLALIGLVIGVIKAKRRRNE